MRYISYNDQELLFESYNSINIKQVILESSLNDFIYNDRPINTLAEAYAILDIYNTIEEAWLPGVGAVMGAAKDGLKSLGTTLGKGAQAVGQKIGQGAQAVGQKIGQGAAALKAGAGQVVDNVGNIYNTANAAADAASVVTQAEEAANILKQLLTAAVQQNQELFKGGALGKGGDPGNQRLIDIINHLAKVKTALANQASTARQGGFTGGVVDAAKQAYQNAAPTAAAAAPAAGGAPATA